MGVMGLITVLAIVSSGLGTEAEASDPQLTAVFEKLNVRGTLVIESLDGATRFVADPERAATRYCPASTFKIPNSLIGLDIGVLSGPQHPFKWNGTEYGFKDWNRDQTLASAFAVSCVWCYQETARAVGRDRFLTYLERFNYGNLNIGPKVDEFWLDNTLQISANEQIGFLRKVVNRELGLKNEAHESLEVIMKADSRGGCDMWAKTGWSTATKPGVGWYVGWVRTEDKTWLFAANIDMNDLSQAPQRKELVWKGLAAKKMCM